MFDHFQAVDVSFQRAVAPQSLDRQLNRSRVATESLGESRHPVETSGYGPIGCVSQIAISEQNRLILFGAECL